LNKLYLICPEPSPESTEKSVALEFAKVFLPVVDRQLFPSASPPQAAKAAAASGPAP
jgi:hypothetical protein